VFGPRHPLEGLIYLTAPISLLVLNPIGFVLLELSREKANGKAGGGNDKRITAVHTLLKVSKGLVINPVIVMSILGVLANVLFSSKPPATITLFLKPIGATFTCLAPFSLGLSMVKPLKL